MQNNILDSGLKNQIHILISLKEELSEVFEMAAHEKHDEIAIMNKYLNMLEKYPGNQLIIKHFLVFLRIAENIEICNSLEIKNLIVLYKLMSQLNPWDIDSESEYYFHLNIFLNKPKKAKKILKMLKKRIAQKKKEWKIGD